MQIFIFIIVVLTLIRGASIIGKALNLGSIQKQVEIAEERVRFFKTATNGDFLVVFFFMLLYGIFLFSISAYVLFQYL